MFNKKKIYYNHLLNNMSYFSYINEDNQSILQDNNNQIQPEQEQSGENIQNRNDQHDKNLAKFNDSVFNWKFSNATRNLGVGIYGTLSKQYNKSSRNQIRQNSLQSTSNSRISEHHFDIQPNDGRHQLYDTESKIRNMPLNNHSIIKQNISSYQNTSHNSNNNISNVEPRQNKYSRYPNQNTTYDGTINAENTLRYKKIKKKKENTTKNSYLNKKKKSLMQPRPNISRLSNEQHNDNSLNNPYLERLYSTDSKNPENRLL